MYRHQGLGGNNTVFVATDKAFVWVFNGEGTLWRIDPITNRIKGTFQITDTGSYMTTGGGFVWVSNISRNEVVRVDRITGETDSVVLQSEPARQVRDQMPAMPTGGEIPTSTASEADGMGSTPAVSAASSSYLMHLEAAEQDPPSWTWTPEREEGAGGGAAVSRRPR
jgi:DNA-binding beta-propeller fold protein YncE